MQTLLYGPATFPMTTLKLTLITVHKP
jgi:hypothetical protein